MTFLRVLTSRNRTALFFALLALLPTGMGCSSYKRPGTPEARTGDEIVVAGKRFHTGTPVVLWTDAGGYDAYRVERRFGPYEKSDWETSSKEVKDLKNPARYGTRNVSLTTNQLEQVRGGGWDLKLLQSQVDEFVIHFDVCGTSRQCFNVLQDHRDLSVQFMLDIDGTIYQTLDLKEKAFQATIANSRSVGIEIANIGAYPHPDSKPLQEWYQTDSNGITSITIPKSFGDGGVRTKGFIGHPARKEIIHGVIQGEDLYQYDFTPEQYAALEHLTATLCKVFPKIKCQSPTDASGKTIPHKLPDDELQKYEGVMGHYHIQTNKTDPGPAFDWDKVISNARTLMK